MAEKINKNDCSICLNYFTKPKIIDCHHTFCTSCLDDYVKRTAKNNQFRCPLCTRFINIPNGGIHDFPVNIYIEEKSAPVSVCRQHKKEKDLYCKDCKITLCYKCFITSHQGHNLQNVEDVESEHKFILEELERKVQTKMASNKSIVESLKKEVLTINQFSAEECEKVDQRIETMYKTLKDEGKKIKLKIQNPTLKQTQVISDMTEDVEQKTKHMLAFGKQIREVLTRCQLDEILNTTQKMRKAINDIDKDFTVPKYECPKFQDGVVGVELLSKQIGEVHKPETRFKCGINITPPMSTASSQLSDLMRGGDLEDTEEGYPVFKHSFDVSDPNHVRSMICRPVSTRGYEVLGNQDNVFVCNKIQGLDWTLDFVLVNNDTRNIKQRQYLDRRYKMRSDGYVKLQLRSPGVKCRASFILKIINVNQDNYSLVNKAEHCFSDHNQDNLGSRTATVSDFSKLTNDFWNPANPVRKKVTVHNYRQKEHSFDYDEDSLSDDDIWEDDDWMSASYSDNRKLVPGRSCVSTEDSYVWGELESDYILNPENGFINSLGRIEINIMFVSIHYEE